MNIGYGDAGVIGAMRRQAERLACISPFMTTKVRALLGCKLAEIQPGDIEKPKKQWFCFTYVLIDHGRAVCAARKPRCEVCPVNHPCPWSLV